MMVWNPAGGGLEVRRGVLGVDPELHGVALDVDILLSKAQLLARRNPDLPFDDVEAGDLFCHRVFDLNPGVDLHEVEVAIFDEELDGSGVGVARGVDAPFGGFADLFAEVLVEGGGGSLLDDLLVAALQRAVPFAEVPDVAVVVGDDLDLDVTGGFEILLDVDGIVIEVGLALALGGLELLFDLVLAVDHF